MTFAGTTKDDAKGVHGSSAGLSTRGKQGGAGSNFSSSTGARRGVMRKGRAAEQLSGDAACLLRRP